MLSSFPDYLNRFRRSENDQCSCGSIGTALHYASTHKRLPPETWPLAHEEVSTKLRTRMAEKEPPVTSSPDKKIHRIVKFISESRGLSLQLFSELHQRSAIRTRPINQSLP
ncbi:hypothetical protein AVEN_32264-1 [Araneus ventricosus]|uniref:Uncharacterized protein n=1 Tax=Araneus ventricosus TaxID=182803 RepID=A0A4Y2J1N2_ARAVE|nr:hypothetical protein AVEN_32264-1 [Araneus ventricosus]